MPVEVDKRQRRGQPRLRLRLDLADLADAGSAVAVVPAIIERHVCVAVASNDLVRTAGIRAVRREPPARAPWGDVGNPEIVRRSRLLRPEITATAVIGQRG